jgi:hypothetical protein
MAITQSLTYEEIRRQYVGEVEKASAGQLAWAESAFKACRERAAKASYVDELSKQCDTPAAAGPAAPAAK